jgi:hypothetical protein
VTFFATESGAPPSGPGGSQSLDAWRRQFSCWACTAKPERFGGKLLRREGTRRMSRETNKILPCQPILKRCTGNRERPDIPFRSRFPDDSPMSSRRKFESRRLLKMEGHGILRDFNSVQQLGFMAQWNFLRGHNDRLEAPASKCRRQPVLWAIVISRFPNIR